jgi:hypothetical protein
MYGYDMVLEFICRFLWTTWEFNLNREKNYFLEVVMVELYGAEFLVRQQLLTNSKNPQHFMEPEFSLSMTNFSSPHLLLSS